MNKKAIFFAIDAIIAVVTATALTMSAFYALANTEPVNLNEERFYELTLSLLDAADKDGTLYSTIDQSDPSLMASYLNELADNKCARARFYDDANIEVLNATKMNCAGQTPKTSTAAWRTVMVNGGMYSSKLEVWWQ